MDIEQEVNESKNLIIEIAKIGRRHSFKPTLRDLFPFEHYFDNDGNLIKKDLDRIDGLWSRREILTRYLLLNVVLDQGPDPEGIGLLLKDVVNSLYQKEVRILHKPLDFFKELEISVDEILERHKEVKKIRAEDWAREINSKYPSRYTLFYAQTQQGMVPTKVLSYALHRWGVPLCVALLLEKDLQKNQKESPEPLVDYIESYNSAENMSKEIKGDNKYGLGSAIGDKGCHLFAKLYIHTFGLVRRRDKSWGSLSYELPFDSNVGRVLFRTGFLLHCADLSDYEKLGIIQKREIKGGKYYIRVTNIREKKSNKFSNLRDLMDSYESVCIEYLKVRKQRPSKIQIQQIPNAILLSTDFGIGDLDDGLIYIGRKYCSNDENPGCSQCPVKDMCFGYKSRRDLITDYRT